MLAALRKDRVDEVRRLLAKGTNVHADNNHLLRKAAYNGHTDIVKLLLAAGADVHARDDGALQWAALADHSYIAKVLLDAGARVTQEALDAARSREMLELLSSVGGEPRISVV